MTIKILYDNSKQFKALEKKIFGLQESVRDPSFRGKMADMVLSMVYKRTKEGFGVSSNNPDAAKVTKVKLQPLSPDYKYRRRSMKLGPMGSAGRSNLTASGQMLEAMRTSLRGFGFSVYIAATRRRGSKLTNARLAQYVAENGRPFMRLTVGEARLVKSEMKIQLKMRLRQLR